MEPGNRTIAAQGFKDVGLDLLAIDRLREEAMRYYDRHPAISAGYFTMAAEVAWMASRQAELTGPNDDVRARLISLGADLAQAAEDVRKRPSRA